MSELGTAIQGAREGDERAFEILVRRFQDMAVGYSYSILRDIQLAQDAAQEAFFEAFRTLDSLREPDAFPGWFRRIVFKHCDRFTRGKQLIAVPIETAAQVSNSSPDQLGALEQTEMKDRIWNAVDLLPEHERETLVLFYIGGYSQKEVCEFLDVPVTTVKKRLHSARNRLRDLLIDEVEDGLRANRPSRDERFAGQLLDLIKAARSGDARRVKELLDENPRLLAARDPMGNTALVVSINSGHNELARLLLDAGVRPDYFEAAAIGDTPLVSTFLAQRPVLLDSLSPEGFTALGLAAHFGHVETLRFLIEKGADINMVSKHPIGVTPLHAALFGGKTETAMLLIESGAEVNTQRGGKGWPRAGWTALHYSAGLGFLELIEPLLARGADINIRDDEGETALRVALDQGHLQIAEALRREGAQE
jgi:RNA polymerase sigma factor (sigma-70 family)